MLDLFVKLLDGVLLVFSQNGFMFEGVSNPSDIAMGYINGTGQPNILDFAITGRNVPSLCPSQAVCPDTNDFISGCADNIKIISGKQMSNFSILEYSRPLVASDNCDVAVNISHINYIIDVYGTLAKRRR